jgi:cysteine sulfinate desulfinase/cysteine desulfurase-like protein
MAEIYFDNNATTRVREVAEAMLPISRSFTVTRRASIVSAARWGKIAEARAQVATLMPIRWK